MRWCLLLIVVSNVVFSEGVDGKRQLRKRELFTGTMESFETKDAR